MLPSRHLEHVEHSRQEILEAVGDHPDLVFVRGYGNLGDELIWAGTRKLLSGRVYREIGIEELPTTSGHTALICGGGAFSRHYHELMPHVLAVAEMRFERVVLLPSTFDTSVDAVRKTLERTQAMVFARERESYSQIQSLCEARLAHDCAFFFDYAPYRQIGAGVLIALRTDQESARKWPIPPESDDISVTAGTLERWLRKISSRKLIRTDRAHVMIAGALLGKTIEFNSSDYFKVPAIADYALRGFPVKRLPPPPTTAPERAAAHLAPSPCSPETEAVRKRLRAQAEINPPPPVEHLRDSTGAPRVTAVILSHDRPELLLGALCSLIYETDIPVNVLVIDNNSDARSRRMLTEACAEHPQVRLHLSDRDLSRVGGRQLGADLTNSELVLFLEDDAELMPGALEHMIFELDHHPNTGAVSALIAMPDGRVSHSGGWYTESEEIVSFTLGASGLSFDDPAIPASGPCHWIPSNASLIRTGLLREFPLDGAMLAYEDNEQCFRIGRAHPDCFRRSREALVLHHAEHESEVRMDFVGRANLVRFISAAAHFYRNHGLLLRVPGVDVFTIMPELTRANEALDLTAARLVMELAGTHSTDWLLMEWMNGGLDPVLGIEHTTLGDELRRSRTEADTFRTELAGLRLEAESARRQIEIERRELEEALSRLKRIYTSRLWKLGGNYDRVRQRALRVKALLSRERTRST
jgi:GT2 family glycosyltransferase/exopolysaccharide biosynthesis predicted pyruvyltransferase EpsI